MILGSLKEVNKMTILAIIVTILCFFSYPITNFLWTKLLDISLKKIE